MKHPEKVYFTAIVDNHVAYFRFGDDDNNTLDCYKSWAGACEEVIGKPNIDAMVVVVDKNILLSEEMQKLWISVGDLADRHALSKWGAVTPTLSKQVAIEFLMKGGADGDRSYASLASTIEDEVLSWAKL